jgi:hypothetical protein
MPSQLAAPQFAIHWLIGPGCQSGSARQSQVQITKGHVRTFVGSGPSIPLGYDFGSTLDI